MGKLADYEIEFEIEIDARGLFCPMPIVRLSKALRENQSKNIFLLMATDAGTAPDLAKWAPPWGHLILETCETQEDGIPVYSFLIQRGSF